MPKKGLKIGKQLYKTTRNWVNCSPTLLISKNLGLYFYKRHLSLIKPEALEWFLYYRTNPATPLKKLTLYE